MSAATVDIRGLEDRGKLSFIPITHASCLKASLLHYPSKVSMARNCEEKATAYFKVLSQHLPKATGVKQHSRKTTVDWAHIRDPEPNE